MATEKSTSAVRETSYKTALRRPPRNQTSPKALLNKPNANPNLLLGTTCAMVALTIGSPTPIPTPHKTVPLSVVSEPPLEYERSEHRRKQDRDKKRREPHPIKHTS